MTVFSEEHMKAIREAPDLWWASLDWMKRDKVMHLFEIDVPYVNGTERQPWTRAARKEAEAPNDD